MLTRLPDSEWNEAAAAHLLNRAGFGGTPDDIRKLASMGLERAVSHLVDYEKFPEGDPPPDWTKPDPEHTTRLLEMRDMQRQIRFASEEEKKKLEDKRREMQRMERQSEQLRVTQLRHWWLGRMASGQRPLQEKMTLLWHGHFATSVIKVKDAVFMWRQNDILRRHATGNWLRLLTEVSKDPAMLVWLDQFQSRREHPNENFAREVMELFALGEGHYTEKDIAEAARALTGWSLDREAGNFIYRPMIHDPGTKTVLGKTGNWNGDDVLKIIAEHPQSGRFLCGKLWSFFARESPPAETVEALNTEFRRHGSEFKPVLRAIFLSREFYSPEVVRSQVKSPVQWLVGSVKLLERPLPGPLECNRILQQLGQELFAPPNVKGWDGGIAWITTNSLLNRYNFAEFLVQGGELGADPGRNPNRMRRLQRMLGDSSPARIDPRRLVPESERSSPEKIVAALERRFLQGTLKEKQSAAIREYLHAESPIDDVDILNAARLVMSTPEYQVT